MWLGREVRFWAILLFCVATVCHGAGARGSEGASGSFTCLAAGGRPISHFSLSCLDISVSWISPSRSDFCRQSSVDSADHPVGMALPDGPGAVCLGVLGFVCVSLVKNRRIWIGLCLFVLSNGRLGSARLSRMGGGVPDLSGPDSLSEGESDHVLWHQSSCGIPDWSEGRVLMPGLPALDLGVQGGSSGWSFDDHGSAGTPGLASGFLTWPLMTQLACVCLGAFGWSAFDGSLEWARPPPGKAQEQQDEMELSSDFRLLARQEGETDETVFNGGCLVSVDCRDCDGGPKRVR